MIDINALVHKVHERRYPDPKLDLSSEILTAIEELMFRAADIKIKFKHGLDIADTCSIMFHELEDLRTTIFGEIEDTEALFPNTPETRAQIKQLINVLKGNQNNSTSE